MYYIIIVIQTNFFVYILINIRNLNIYDREVRMQALWTLATMSSESAWNIYVELISRRLLSVKCSLQSKKKKKKYSSFYLLSIFSMFCTTHPFFYIRSPHNVSSIDENRRDGHFRLFVSSVSSISRSTVQFTVITRRGCLLSTVARRRLRQ